MIQILCHLWGDYILQSDWMTQYKRKSLLVAMVHAIAYMLPFAFFIRPSTAAFTVMLFTHAVIDRFGLARYLVFAKNWLLAPRWWVNGGDTKRWAMCEKTGYIPTLPDWMAVWLLIIADNTLHLTINYLALRFL